jgi:hypothetical protein
LYNSLIWSLQSKRWLFLILDDKYLRYFVLKNGGGMAWQRRMR